MGKGKTRDGRIKLKHLFGYWYVICFFANGIA